MILKQLHEGSEYLLGSSSAEDESYEESKNLECSIKKDELDEESEIHNVQLKRMNSMSARKEKLSKTLIQHKVQGKRSWIQTNFSF
jgi:hypothetical protein